MEFFFFAPFAGFGDVMVARIDSRRRVDETSRER
jgi:hypothetical protein